TKSLDEEGYWNLKVEYNGNSNMSIRQNTQEMTLQSGGVYTLSFYIRGNVKDLSYMHLVNRVSPNQALSSIDTSDILETNWIRKSITFVKNPSENPYTSVMIGSNSGDTGEWFEIKKV